MSEYIDREALVIDLDRRHDFLEEMHGGGDQYTMGFLEAVLRVENFWTADVAHVRHGRVVEAIENGRMKRVFSCCGEGFTELTCRITPNYCPNCGAKIDEVSE